MSALFPTPDNPRPRQVTLGATLAITGSIVLLFGLVNAMTQLESLTFTDFLKTSIKDLGLSADLTVERLRTYVKYVIMLLAVLSVAAVVLGVYVLKRDRAARVGLTVVVGVMGTMAVLQPATWLITLYAAISIGLLWSAPARAWFAGTYSPPKPSGRPAKDPWSVKRDEQPEQPPRPPFGQPSDQRPDAKPGPWMPPNAGPPPGWQPPPGWVPPAPPPGWQQPPPGWVPPPPPGWGPPPGWQPPPGWVPPAPPPGWVPPTPPAGWQPPPGWGPPPGWQPPPGWGPPPGWQPPDPSTVRPVGPPTAMPADGVEAGGRGDDSSDPSGSTNPEDAR